ncbi:hypothetical protein [Streptomyces sp. ISL-11]|uniref:hypothetical protein n=1 Tax=Streptomyces sp. ISL-11 TaxID=2819174 RepID=UPI001BE9C5D7|nr:hypothetical protein [Streptomyces sp. ISL-11]MBT2386363.1 hypothetical protein [Streptomyces sp. ISL-11]
MNRRGRTVAVGALALVAGGAFITSGASAAPTAGTGTTAATTYWAKVTAGGSLVAGSGITGVYKFGNGRYNLYTNFNASNCALTGTLNTNGGSDPGPGTSSILVGAVSSSTLFVRTATPSSQSVDDDRPFSLVIAC